MLVRALALTFGLLLVAVMLIDWNALIWTGSDRATNNAELLGLPSDMISEVTGYVVEENVDDNQPVRRGQLLFRIEDDYPEASLALAEAQLETFKASLAVARASYEQQQATLAAALNTEAASAATLRFAAEDAKRWEALRGTPGDLLRSRQQSDAALASAQSLDAADARAVAIARATLSSSALAITRARADLRSGTDAVDLAKIRLRWTRVVSPVGGRVTERVVHLGQYVTAGQRLITVVKLPGTWAEAWFREEQAEGMHVGQTATIHVDAYPTLHLTGCVASLGPNAQNWVGVTPPNRATGNFTKVVQRVPVKVTYLTPPGFEQLLIPGLSIEVRVHTAGPSCTPLHPDST